MIMYSQKILLKIYWNDIPGLQNGIDIVSYGNSLFDRLIKLKIDEDILYKQFSVKLMCMNYYEVYIFWFSKSIYYFRS